MKFRFFNPKSIHKIYISTLNCNRNNFYPHHNPVIQALCPPLYDPSLTHSENPNSIISKRWHGGHCHHHHHHDHRSGKEGENVFRLGLAADIGLAAGKAMAGYLSGSTAIIADAAHSVSDVVLSGVALFSYKAARVPKDKEHPYGHGKFESLGALGISSVLLGTAGVIAWHAFDILMGLLSAAPEIIDHSAHKHMPSHGHHHGIDMSHPILALNTMLVSLSVKEGLYWITKRAGERSGSGLMKANAWHHRADAVSSLVALVGVGGSIVGVKFLDPLAGLLVSGMILKAGLEAGYGSVLELVDAAVPSQLLDPIRQTIQQVEGVKGCSHLRGRRAGSSLHLDVNIEVDPFYSVSAAHEVEENVRDEIWKSHPEVAEVFIHIEPSFSNVSLDKMDQQKNMKEADHPKSNVSSNDKHIEDIISALLAAKFAEQMVVQRITRHLLQGKTLLQVEVSMPPDILVRDAIKLAEAAQRDILVAVSDVVQVCIQLQLGVAIPQARHEF